MNPTSQAERIRALEVRVEQLSSEISDMNKKLDDLLALRDKGVGAFWLAAALFGTGIAGLGNLLISWLRG